MTSWCKSFNSIDRMLEGDATYLCAVEGQFHVNMPIRMKLLQPVSDSEKGKREGWSEPKHEESKVMPKICLG